MHLHYAIKSCGYYNLVTLYFLQTYVTTCATNLLYNLVCKYLIYETRQYEIILRIFVCYLPYLYTQVVDVCQIDLSTCLDYKTNGYIFMQKHILIV